jgi:hypothetical protein
MRIGRHLVDGLVQRTITATGNLLELECNRTLRHRSGTGKVGVWRQWSTWVAVWCLTSTLSRAGRNRANQAQRATNCGRCILALVESKFSSGGYCTTGTSVRSRRTLAATGDPNAHDPMALNSAVAPAWPFEPKADRKGRFRLLA